MDVQCVVVQCQITEPLQFLYRQTKINLARRFNHTDFFSVFTQINVEHTFTHSCFPFESDFLALRGNCLPGLLGVGETMYPVASSTRMKNRFTISFLFEPNLEFAVPTLGVGGCCTVVAAAVHGSLALVHPI